MLRNILAVLAGFVLWTVLWLGSNAGILRAFPGSFREDGGTDSAGILLLLVILSVLFSLLAGYAVAALARQQAKPYVWALGAVLLAVGVFVQIQYWELMPVWYHVSFLLLLVPATVIGGTLRLRR